MLSRCSTSRQHERGALIEQGTYGPGERIPSVRRMSRQQGVSISTVLQAYMLLENRGLIEARPQSGYYVSVRQSRALPEPEMSSPGPDPSQVSLHQLVMMLLREFEESEPGAVGGGAAQPGADPNREDRAHPGFTGAPGRQRSAPVPVPARFGGAARANRPAGSEFRVQPVTKGYCHHLRRDRGHRPVPARCLPPGRYGGD